MKSMVEAWRVQPPEAGATVEAGMVATITPANFSDDDDVASVYTRSASMGGSISLASGTGAYIPFADVPGATQISGTRVVEGLGGTANGMENGSTRR